MPIKNPKTNEIWGTIGFYNSWAAESGETFPPNNPLEQGRYYLGDKRYYEELLELCEVVARLFGAMLM